MLDNGSVNEYLQDLEATHLKRTSVKCLTTNDMDGLCSGLCDQHASINRHVFAEGAEPLHLSRVGKAGRLPFLIHDLNVELCISSS
jgi:hypothetical protein